MVALLENELFPPFLNICVVSNKIGGNWWKLVEIASIWLFLMNQMKNIKRTLISKHTNNEQIEIEAWSHKKFLLKLKITTLTKNSDLLKALHFFI